MLNKAQEIIDLCREKNCHIYDLVIENECKTLKMTEEELRAYVDKVIEVMKDSAKSNLTKSDETRFKMIDGFSKITYKYATDKEPIIGRFAAKAMAMAFSTSEVNAAMGKIIAAPTAGSSGIMPAMLVAASERYNFDKETLQNGFLTSVGIGQIIGKYATFAGAEGGCQAECGSASAMATSALVEMLGGSPEEILNAASITLINVLGLVCDPIAGLVQYPCTFRNASGVINAFIAADLALAGVKSIVPFEEVVQAMSEVGTSLDEGLRETGLGGLAGTKTGQAIRKNFLNLEEKND
ncbi:L-serine ammonia-lyase, iron-sulfur-dependent, subunit alpha [Peptoniphilus catoniae]|uniref:L-serine ammonia-lyase, iron-sulfur-dependent, subunit alpha n=1 Tax=Peptoniphilus catoniae TaxID=1660341 RepID=UPI0010FCDE6C|nr:L-serine ammonia-lyase, iron-sulfur-dependent, subunit alpha [Peptoniphilus catoniae]